MAGRKIVVFNRKASHEYFLEERFEAGLVLQGTEIKSIRQGHVQIRDAYISFTMMKLCKGMAYSGVMSWQPVQS